MESARYPYLYYWPAVFLYKLFYFTDIFVRVYVIRLWSLILFLGTVAFSLKIGKLIFPKDKLSFVTLAILVGFQPMMIFSNVGVNSDALGNFLFTLFLYLSVKLLILGPSKNYFIFLILISILSIYSKPQFIIILPLVLLLLLWMILREFLKNRKRKTLIYLIFMILFLTLGSYVFRANMITFTQFLAKVNLPSLSKYTREYTISHTISEVLPWYWGIYDWLGVTYPRIVHRIINRLVIIAGI